ncbi:MAG: fructose-bisphosphate aldolase class I [Gammaproteobacteria bacterium]|nr:MAG: fructose-bisphosphate aldolase class I [Gammaproteobacteria bacterium]|tara:strand:- start:1277 stop:2287 length:1011 start_codon:yes stop_codon:yes gene_type:complete
MTFTNIEDIANYLVADGKGFLAADESTPTIGKRFDAINTESTETSRRDYRELLFRASGMDENISGVILFDETLRQASADNTLLKDVILKTGALPGIKVDKGVASINDSEEVLTGGLDGLEERCTEYESLGAKFTKWRAVIKIGENMPSDNCIEANMQALADYAKIVQQSNMVPIVEPEVLMDGEHSADACFDATSRCLNSLFANLESKGVNIKGVILKPNMVLAGQGSSSQLTHEDVAELTMKCLLENVPEDLPGIAFLSGGQSDIDATANLDALNKLGGNPWKLTFSYGRALQQAALKSWLGQSENVVNAQEAFSHRAKMNRLAALGKWAEDLEG